MERHPSGIVSFLFTAIEGSTRLLKFLGTERYAVALDEHCALLRAAFERHDGYEVDSDAFLVAFESATGAVAAAEAAQRAQMSHDWPDAHPFHVRMGIHYRAAIACSTQIRRGGLPPRCAHHGRGPWRPGARV